MKNIFIGLVFIILLFSSCASAPVGSGLDDSLAYKKIEYIQNYPTTFSQREFDRNSVKWANQWDEIAELDEKASTYGDLVYLEGALIAQIEIQDYMTYHTRNSNVINSDNQRQRAINNQLGYRKILIATLDDIREIIDEKDLRKANWYNDTFMSGYNKYKFQRMR
jgi:hypothetical protein